MRVVCLLSFLFLAGNLDPGNLAEAAQQTSMVQLGERQPVTEISFDGKELTGVFNATADRTRLVIVFSPT